MIRSKIKATVNWFESAKSPKGRLRFKEMALLGVALLFAAWLGDSVMFEGWTTQTILQFSKAGFGCLFTYLTLRLVRHKRSHELSEEDRRQRELSETIGYCIVIGFCLGI